MEEITYDGKQYILMPEIRACEGCVFESELKECLECSSLVKCADRNLIVRTKEETITEEQIYEASKNCSKLLPNNDELFDFNACRNNIAVKHAFIEGANWYKKQIENNSK